MVFRYGIIKLIHFGFSSPFVDFPFFCCCFDVFLENLRCPGCCTAFASEARLGKHFTVSQLCLTKWESMVGTQKVLHRSRYTIDTKCKVLAKLVELEQKKVPMAQSVLRLRHSDMISAKNISTWSFSWLISLRTP